MQYIIIDVWIRFCTYFVITSRLSQLWKINNDLYGQSHVKTYEVKDLAFNREWLGWLYFQPSYILCLVLILMSWFHQLFTRYLRPVSLERYFVTNFNVLLKTESICWVVDGSDCTYFIKQIVLFITKSITVILCIILLFLYKYILISRLVCGGHIWNFFFSLPKRVACLMPSFLPCCYG